MEPLVPFFPTDTEVRTTFKKVNRTRPPELWVAILFPLGAPHKTTLEPFRTFQQC